MPTSACHAAEDVCAAVLRYAATGRVTSSARGSRTNASSALVVCASCSSSTSPPEQSRPHTCTACAERSTTRSPHEPSHYTQANDGAGGSRQETRVTRPQPSHGASLEAGDRAWSSSMFAEPPRGTRSECDAGSTGWRVNPPPRGPGFSAQPGGAPALDARGLDRVRVTRSNRGENKPFPAFRAAAAALRHRCTARPRGLSAHAHHGTPRA